MGFFSRLIEILTGKQQQHAAKATSTSTQSHLEPTKPIQPALEVKAAAKSDLEKVPQAEVAQQVEQVSSELAAIVQAAQFISISKKNTAHSPVVEDLSEKILGWGESGQTRYIPQLLKYANSSDHDVRAVAAMALGEIARANQGRTEVQRIVPLLGKLSSDRQPQVSQSAVTALGAIRSENVLPFLQRALRSPSGNVSKAASVAIRQLKPEYRKQLEPSIFKPKVIYIHHRF